MGNKKGRGGISCAPFGTTKAGAPVLEFTLDNGRGANVRILNYGCTVRAIEVPDRDGALRDVCLGYAGMEDYEAGGDFIGATVGRCANRIGGSRFTLGEEEYPLFANDGANHLHGGRQGFDKHVWAHRVKGDALLFSRTSPHMEEGYPGTLQVEVSFRFTGEGALVIDYSAVSDADTVVNLTNHTYFNLAGGGTVLGHVLHLNAESYTPAAADLLPTGQIEAVAGTPFDFRTPKDLGRGMPTGGYDHNFVLRGSGLREIGTLYAPESGIVLHVGTDLPGVQLYSGNSISSAPTTKGGGHYRAHEGVCLETQYYPDAVHHPAFPSPVLKAGAPYRTTTIYQFGVLA